MTVNATNPGEGILSQYWAKAEATYDTIQALAATDAVAPIELKIEGGKAFHRSKQHVGTASAQNMIAGRRDGKWSAKFHLQPAAAGTPPDILDILKCFMTQTQPGGNSVNYALNDSAPGSIQLVRYIPGVLYEVASGCIVEQMEIDFDGGGEPTITFSGQFGTFGWAYGCDTVNDISAGAGSGDYNLVHIGDLAKNAVVAFGAKNNGGTGYTITAVDNTASPPTYTFSPVMEAGGTTGVQKITPVVPAQTLGGTIIGGTSASLTIGGNAVNVIKGKVIVKTGHHTRNKEATQDRSTGSFRGSREISCEFDGFFLDRETAPIVGRAYDGAAARAVVLRLGANTAALRWKVNINAFFEVTSIEVPEADESMVKIKSAQALQSSTANDEFSMLLD